MVACSRMFISQKKSHVWTGHCTPSELVHSSSDRDGGRRPLFQFIAYAIVGDFAAPKRIVFLVAWLWFYWIDLSYTNRMPLPACRISFWFNFYDCSEISQFDSRTNSPPPSSSSHDTLSLAPFTTVLSIWWIKFGMRVICTFFMFV